MVAGGHSTRLCVNVRSVRWVNAADVNPDIYNDLARFGE